LLDSKNKITAYAFDSLVMRLGFSGGQNGTLEALFEYNENENVVKVKYIHVVELWQPVGECPLLVCNLTVCVFADKVPVDSNIQQSARSRHLRPKSKTSERGNAVLF
jgi:hypothetical protein